MKKLLSLTGLALLLGAGCASQTTVNTNTNVPPAPVMPPVSETSTEVVPPVVTPTPPEATSTAPAATSTVSVDDTWKTYTNNALHFSFKYPTKGLYVPQWEVKFVPANDSAIKNDCYEPSNTPGTSTEDKSDVNGVSFCHTSYSEGAAGSKYITDYYATKNGNQYILLTFTKRVVNAGALNCNFVDQYQYSVSLNSCVPFVPDQYQSLLNLILSTFQYQK